MGGSVYCPSGVPAPAVEIKGHVAAIGRAAPGKKSVVCTAEVAGSNWSSLYAILWPTLRNISSFTIMHFPGLSWLHMFYPISLLQDQSI